MKMKEYACTDNFYSCYVEYRWIYKHIFRPNPISGKNSASRVRAENQIKEPQRKFELRDKTKYEIYSKKETI